MHRSIEITVDPEHSQKLIEELQELEDVVSLSVLRGGSLKPPGDVVTVHALNRGADEVWKRADAARAHGPVSISTGELISIVSDEQQETVRVDVDEAVWEEMDSNLRHQGQVTINYLLLMALGGAVAAAAILTEHVNQAILLAAASIIAPGFEPVAMISLGISLRRWHVVRRGLTSTALGYLAVALGGLAAFGVLHLMGDASVTKFLESPEVQQVAHPTGMDLLTSFCAAFAGVIMMTAYRRHVIAGPLIALKLIPATAILGAAIAAGQFRFVDEALRRWAIDVGLIIFLGVLFLLFKQVSIHRRRMLS